MHACEDSAVFTQQHVAMHTSITVAIKAHARMHEDTAVCKLYSSMWTPYAFHVHQTAQS
jgi:hypothetical protein